MQVPQTRYAKSGDVHIAYQLVGDGPMDLVFVPGFVSHVEHWWEYPPIASFIRRLASFSRLILFDKRGTGLSDRTSDVPTLEQRMDDVRAVMDAAGSERAAVFGVSEGGPMSALFAATYPDRTPALVLYGAFAKFIRDPEYPWAPPAETYGRVLNWLEDSWGTGASAQIFAPSLAQDEAFRDWWARFERAGASPGAMLALMQMNAGIDVRNILPTIRVPTLVMHVTGDHIARVEGGRYIAERIRGARYVELPGEDHIMTTNADAILNEIQEFLTGVRPAPEADRVLATVLFTDIVDSTRRASELGDRRWRELLDSYYAVARRHLGQFRGREVKTLGDGFLATFDGPARAILCAQAVVDGARAIGLEMRAGLHTGECEIVGEDVGGIAVHIGARVSALAGPGEVLVSSTVKDLVAGSGIEFVDRGGQALRGVPGEWRLFSVAR